MKISTQTLIPVRRGQGVADRVFDEIAELYGDSVKITPTGVYSVAPDPLASTRPGCSDVDAATGHVVYTSQWESYPGEKTWAAAPIMVSADATRDGHEIGKTPRTNDWMHIQDVSLHSSSRRVVIKGERSYFPGVDMSRPHKLYEYEVGAKPGWVGSFMERFKDPIYESEEPIGPIEFASDGKLLVGQGHEVKRLEGQQLVSLLEFPYEVTDINTLSDGGLCVRTSAPGRLGTNIYYQASPETEPVSLYVPDLVNDGKVKDQEKSRFRFIRSMSKDDMVDFLASNPTGECWWDSTWPQEYTSPDGEKTMLLQVNYNDGLYARDGSSDLGRLASFGSEGPSPRFAQPMLDVKADDPLAIYTENGADYRTCFWSPDSRLFVATSHADCGVGLRDAWVWDSVERKAHLLPNVSQVAALPDGRLEVSVPGKDPMALGVADFPQVGSGKELRSRPQLLMEGEGVVLKRFEGEEKVLVENRDDYSTLIVSGDGQDLIGIKKGSADLLGHPTGAQQVTVWNLASSARIDLMEADRAEWIAGKDELCLVGQEAVERLSLKDIRNLPAYQSGVAAANQSLLSEFGLAPGLPSAVVEADSQGVRIGGLAMPSPGKKLQGPQPRLVAGWQSSVVPSGSFAREFCAFRPASHSKARLQAGLQLFHLSSTPPISWRQTTTCLSFAIPTQKSQKQTSQPQHAAHRDQILSFIHESQIVDPAAPDGFSHEGLAGDSHRDIHLERTHHQQDPEHQQQPAQDPCSVEDADRPGESPDGRLHVVEVFGILAVPAQSGTQLEGRRKGFGFASLLQKRVDVGGGFLHVGPTQIGAKQSIPGLPEGLLRKGPLSLQPFELHQLVGGLECRRPDLHPCRS